MDDTHATPVRRSWTFGCCLLAVSLGLAGCSNYVGTTAASFLRRIKEEPDPNLRYLAYAKLASPNCYDSEEQKEEAARALVAKLEKGREPVATRAMICRTLGALGKPEAREAMLKAINDPEGVVRIEACRALGRVGRAEDATVLARMMVTDTLEDCRIAAVDSLAELKPDDPRITRMLVGGMSHEDPALRLASLNALRAITGRDLGVSPEPWVELVESEATGPEDSKQPAGARSLVESFPPRDEAMGAASYPPKPLHQLPKDIR